MAGKRRSRVEMVTAVVVAAVAVCSLGLNVAQYRASRSDVDLAVAKEFPRLSTFRIRLSTVAVRQLADLAESGADLAHLPNPAFLQLSELERLPVDRATTVEFQVLANAGPAPVDSVDLHFRDGAVRRLAGMGAPATLLVPRAVIGPAGSARELAEPDSATFHYTIGRRPFSETILVPPPRETVVVFELGLGPVAMSLTDFDAPFERELPQFLEARPR